MSTVILNMQEAKTHLSKHVANLRKGDRVVLCRRGKPVAEIRPIVEKPCEPRPIGLGRGLVTIPDSFFDPLPDEVLDLFQGKEV